MSIILLMTRVYKKINGFSLSKQILANEGQGINKILWFAWLLGIP